MKQNSRILEILWKLNDLDLELRLSASEELLLALKDSEASEVDYVVGRMIKGLLSSNKCARQGYASVLTQFLIENPSKYDFSAISEKANKLILLSANANRQETKDFYFAKVFLVLVLCQSQLFATATDAQLEFYVDDIFSLMEKKKWLPDLCCGALDQLIKSVSGEQLEGIIEPRVSAWMASTSTSSTLESPQLSPNDLFLGVSLFNRFSELNLTIPQSVEKFQQILTNLKLSENENENENVQKLSAPLLSSTIVHPQIHAVWKTLLDRLIANWQTSKDATPIRVFWEKVVIPFLYSSARRKFVVFHVFEYLLPFTFSAQEDEQSELVGILFSANFLTALADSVKFKMGMVHQCAVRSCEAIKAQAEAHPEVVVAMLGMFSKLSFKFDGRARMSVTQHLTQLLDSDVIERVLDEKSATGDSSTCEKEKIGEVFALLKHPKVGEGKSLEMGVGYLLRTAFVGGEEVPLECANLAKERVLTLVADFRKSEKLPLLFEIIDRTIVTKSKSKSKKKTKASANFSEEFIISRKETAKLLKKASKSKKEFLSESQLENIHLFFSYLLLLQLSDAEEASGLISDLSQALSQALSSSDKDSALEQLMLVALDILLVLLAKPTSLYRKFSQSFVRVFASSVTKTCLQDLVAAISSQEDAFGDDDEDLSDAEDDDDSDDQMEIDETLSVDEQSGKSADSEKCADSDKSEKSDHSESEEESEEEEEEEIDINDDQEVDKYETHLAAYMKLRTEAKRAKQEQVSQLVNFKVRVVDLLEVIVKVRENDTLFIGTVVPLLELVGGVRNAVLLAKVSSCLTKLVAQKPKLVKLEEAEREEQKKQVFAFAEKVAEMATEAGNSQQLERTRSSFMYFLRMLVSEAFQVKQTSELVEKLAGNLFAKKKSKLSLHFLVSVFDAFPKIGWSVLPKLAHFSHSAVDGFSRFEAFLAVDAVLRHKKSVCEESFGRCLGELEKGVLAARKEFGTSAVRLKAVEKVAMRVGKMVEGQDKQVTWLSDDINGNGKRNAGVHSKQVQVQSQAKKQK